MDDPTGHDSGYTPAQYAFVLLRAEPVDNSMVATTSDNDALALSTAIEQYEENAFKIQVADTVKSWAISIDIVKEFLKAGNPSGYQAAVQQFQGPNSGGNISEHTADTLVDSISKGIIAVPAQVQTAMDATTG